MNFTKPFSALIGSTPVVKLTVDDAISALKETLTKLGDVVLTREKAVAENRVKIEELTAQINIDAAESERAKNVANKLAALLN